MYILIIAVVESVIKKKNKVFFKQSFFFPKLKLNYLKLFYII